MFIPITSKSKGLHEENAHFFILELRRFFSFKRRFYHFRTKYSSKLNRAMENFVFRPMRISLALSPCASRQSVL